MNRNLKRSQYEDIADPDKRAVHGNTFTHMIVALASVVENLRKIMSFFKRRLAIVPLTAKNKCIPSVFWQPEVASTEGSHPDQPPG